MQKKAGEQKDDAHPLSWSKRHCVTSVRVCARALRHDVNFHTSLIFIYNKVLVTIQVIYIVYKVLRYSPEVCDHSP